MRRPSKTRTTNRDRPANGDASNLQIFAPDRALYVGRKSGIGVTNPNFELGKTRPPLDNRYSSISKARSNRALEGASQRLSRIFAR